MTIHILSACFFVQLLCAAPLAAVASTSKNNPDSLRVTVTAYTARPKCLQNKPSLTASSIEITPDHYKRIIALSPDLARNYQFGDQFHLHVKGKSYQVEYQDKMSGKHKNRIDILLPTRKDCLTFGITQGVLVPLEPDS